MTHVHGRVTPCSCNVYEDQKLVFVCLETVIQKNFKSVTHSKSTHVLFILPGVKLSVDESAPLGDRMVKPGYRLSALRQTHTARTADRWKDNLYYRHGTGSHTLSRSPKPTQHQCIWWQDPTQTSPKMSPLRNRIEKWMRTHQAAGNNINRVNITETWFLTVVKYTRSCHMSAL